MKRIVVLSGAGVSAESGIKTFRDTGGLWEEYNIEDVATPQAWLRDMELVQRFYNERRKQMMEVLPNAAHTAIAALEEHFDVHVVTQNVDNLHERAGSSNVLHLHGELVKSRSSIDPELIYEIDGWEIKMGDLCEKGSQLRPHIVWFGEMVPELENAAKITQTADLLIVVGTSLNVYPAASLIHYAAYDIPKFLIDPNNLFVDGVTNLTFIKEKAGKGMPLLREKLITEWA